jgi:GT2 family glycosyltransferase
MPGVRVELKKQIMTGDEVRVTSEDVPRIRDLRVQIAALLTRVEAAEAERKRLRQSIEQHDKQLAAINSELQGMIRRDVEIRSLLLDTTRERDDLYRQNEELYAELYALHAKLFDLERNGSNGSVDTKVDVDDKAAQYHRLVRRIREVVCAHVPREATIIVASKGDEELLRLYGRKAWHFPQTESGVYAGHHPSHSTAAIVHLETLRAKGAEHLLLPSTMFWWLDHYVEFRRYLETYYGTVVRQDDACLIFALRSSDVSRGLSWQAQFSEAIVSFQGPSDQKPSILDWNTDLNLAAKFPDFPIFSPPKTEHLLPYMDGTVDVVAIASRDFISRTEAQRVASAAVVSFSGSPERPESEPVVEIEWKRNVSMSQTLTSSILLPCCNSLTETETCLAAVTDSLPRNFEGEIVLLDAASTNEFSDGIQRLAKSHAHVRILRNRSANTFLSACNRAAKAAKGDILVFVNSVFLPLRGWFPPLLQIFRNYPKAGAVGGKLIDSDGKLHEAGGIVFSNGSIAGFGNADSQVDAPLYNFVREVDFCSVTFFATRRLLFEELNGFDIGFDSLDYSAADYGLKIRRKGCQVLYQPESAFTYLHRPITDHTDKSREIFVRRWADSLKQRPAFSPAIGLGSWQDVASQL